jgi:hypothetical protein
MLIFDDLDDEGVDLYVFFAVEDCLLGLPHILLADVLEELK